HRDDHHILMLGQACAVVANGAARSLVEAAAMEPDHHGTLARAVRSGRPNVQIQTVFAEITAIAGSQNVEELQFASRRAAGWIAERNGRRPGRHARPSRTRAAGAAGSDLCLRSARRKECL